MLIVSSLRLELALQRLDSRESSMFKVRFHRRAMTGSSWGSCRGNVPECGKRHLHRLKYAGSFPTGNYLRQPCLDGTKEVVDRTRYLRSVIALRGPCFAAQGSTSLQDPLSARTAVSNVTCRDQRSLTH